MSNAMTKICSAEGAMRHDTHLKDVAAAATKGDPDRTDEEAKLLDAERLADDVRSRSVDRRARPELYRITPEQAREIDMRVAAEREASGSSASRTWTAAEAVAIVSRAWDEYRNTVNSRLAMGGAMTAPMRAIEMGRLDPVGLTQAVGAAVFGEGPMASLSAASADDAPLQAAQRDSDSAAKDVRSFGVGMITPCGVPAHDGGPSPAFSIDMQKLDAEMNPPPTIGSRLAGFFRRLLGR